METTRPFLALCRRALRGFTLIELCVVLTIMSILLGTGAPALSAMLRSSRLTSASNDLLASILLARSEAAKRNTRVVVCKSADGALCASSGGWEQGWIVFQDSNNDGVRESTEEIVWRGHGLSGDLRVLGNLTVARYVSYAPTGEAKLAGGGFQAGTITLCNAGASSQDARQIIINAVGRPRVQKTRVASCA